MIHFETTQLRLKNKRSIGRVITGNLLIRNYRLAKKPNLLSRDHFASPLPKVQKDNLMTTLQRIEICSHAEAWERVDYLIEIKGL
jgi:hypothetical protein